MRYPQELVQRQVRDAVRALHERGHQPSEGAAVAPEARNRPLKGAVRQRRPAAVEGGAVGDLGNLQPDPPGQFKLPEERRGQGHRMHRRAHIVEVAGLHEFGGAQPAARGGRRLVDVHLQSGAGQGHRRGEAVRS